MPEVRKTVIVPYTPAQMFALVDGVERYPEFLPWCTGTVVLLRDAQVTRAALEVAAETNRAVAARRTGARRRRDRLPPAGWIGRIDAPFGVSRAEKGRPRLARFPDLRQRCGLPERSQADEAQ